MPWPFKVGRRFIRTQSGFAFPGIGSASTRILPGVLVAQFQDPQSPVRARLRAPSTKSTISRCSPRVDSTSRSAFNFVAVLTFRRDAGPLRLAVWGDPLVEFATERRLLMKADLPAMRRGGTRVDFGALMIPKPGWLPRHSVFGCPEGSDGLPHLAVSIVPNSGWLVHFELGGQTERFLFWVRDFKQTNGLGMVVATPTRLLGL